MMKSITFATRRLTIVLNRFGWLMAILWIAILAYEKKDKQQVITTASVPSCTCPRMETP